MIGQDGPSMGLQASRKTTDEVFSNMEGDPAMTSWPMEIQLPRKSRFYRDVLWSSTRFRGLSLGNCFL